MHHYYVRQYKSDDYDIWNQFVSNSKNGTFLFHRDFMEYHSDRFEDYSLLIYKKEVLIAVLPANITETSVYSHQGLTYGGLLYLDSLKLASIVEILSQVLQFFQKNNVYKFISKEIPSIYCQKHADDLLYALFLAQAKLTRRDSLSVVDLKQPQKYSKDRREGIKKGENAALIIKEEESFELFWNQILEPNLWQKHQAKPVHSALEMQLLKNKFPQNIRQFNVYNQNKIVAGTTVFVSNNVAHSQYISGNEDKNALGSLDILHHYLLTKVFSEKKYFDFGISNERNGKILNQGLVYWKQSFDAHTVTQDFYEVDPKNYIYLEEVLK